MPIVAVPGFGRVAFPEDMTPEEIRAAVAQIVRDSDTRVQRAQAEVGAPPLPGLPAGLAPTPRAIPPPPAGPSLPSTVASVGTEALPMVGGMAGGLAGLPGGLPGAVGGAALGGAGGEAFRQLINRARGRETPSTPLEAATDIAGEGAVQGVSELVGQGLGRGITGIGRAMVENAVRPPITFQNEFPHIIDTVVRERLPVGAGLLDRTKGSTLAKRKLQASSRALRRLLVRAEASGKTFSPSDVATPVLELIDDLAKQPLGDAEEKALAGMIDEFLRRHPGPLTPQAVKELKQSAQAIAKPIYRAQAAGNVVPADQALSRRFNEAIASGSKTALETIPGVGRQEGQTQALIGATKAIRRAEQRRLSLMAEGITGAGSIVGALLAGQHGGLDEGLKTGVTAYLVARGLMSPRSISRVGLQLTRRQTRELFRQFPRLAVAVVKAAGAAGTSTPDTPSPLPRTP